MRLSIKNSFFLYFLIGVLCPIFFLYYQSSKNIDELVQSNVQYEYEMTKKSIEKIMQSFEYKMMSLGQRYSKNLEVINVIKNNSEESDAKVKALLKEETIYNLQLLDKENKILKNYGAQFPFRTWYLNKLGFYKQGKKYFIYTRNPVYDGEKTIGHIFVVVKIQPTLIEKNIPVIIVDDNSNIIFDNEKLNFLKIYKNFDKFFNKKGVFERRNYSEKIKLSVFPIQLRHQSYKALVQVDLKELENVKKGVGSAFVSFLFFIILFSSFMLYFLYKKLTIPIKNLINATYEVERGSDSDEIKFLTKFKSTDFDRLNMRFFSMYAKVKNSEKKLNKSITRLEKTNQRLQKAQSQVIQTAKMASLGQLVAGTAHELNNSIGFIYSNIASLKNYSKFIFDILEKPELLNEDKNKEEMNFIKEDFPLLINSFEEGAIRSKDIVDGLKNYSRSEKTKLRKVNIGNAIISSVDLFKSHLGKGVDLKMDLKDSFYYNLEDGPFKQVLMNLISNAIHAVEPQGKVLIQLYEADKKFIISVTDDGPGIPLSVQESVFDPFFTTKPIGRGTGLGLSLSKRIIERHKGKIYFHTSLGKGTSFYIELPLVNEEKPDDQLSSKENVNENK